MTRLAFAIAAVLCLLLTQRAIANQTSKKAADRGEAKTRDTTVERDGSHDFDFNIGKWHTHIRRLTNPLSGASPNWMILDGTVTVQKVWDGRAQLEEIEADGPKGHWEGLTLFLYDPEAHQWSQNFAGSSEGKMETPTIGEFKNGIGEFYDQETYNGRAVLVRGVWADITSDSHSFTQYFSNDGGKTWEANFIATLTRS